MMRTTTPRHIGYTTGILCILVVATAAAGLGWIAGGAVTAGADRTVGLVVGVGTAIALVVALGHSLWRDRARVTGSDPGLDALMEAELIADVELGRVHLCYLHEDDEPDHWCTADEIVGVYLMDGDAIRTEQAPSPAHRECASRLIEPERITVLDPQSRRN
jgi:hypothetical protein